MESGSLQRSSSPLPFWRVVAALLAVCVSAAACQSTDTGAPSTTSSAATSVSTATTNTTDATPTSAASTVALEHHTASMLRSESEFEQLARLEQPASGRQRAAVKFAIPDLSEPGVVWMDSSFFELHDEWYWYNLLNGRSLPELEVAPVVDGPSFDTIDEIYEWAEEQTGSLPLDLEFVAGGERLYSPEFYERTLRDRDKTYGLGTLIRYDTDEGDRWVIELQFSEPTTVESVEHFVARLAETLPVDIGDRLQWVPRSPDQAATAEALEAAGLGDLVVEYADLVPQGEVEVYNPGVTAGRLRLISDPSDLNLARPDDILIMQNVPDWLPPATAVLTASPQTPLAHVSLLARNRGIPNVSVSGLLDDPALSIAARSRSHAVVRATAAGDLTVTLISQQQFDEWNARRTRAPIVVPNVDLATLPTVLSLEDLARSIDSEADVEALRPTIGGKSAGFLALMGADGVTTPDSPLAVTVAPYFRHLSLVEAELDAMLGDPDFGSDPRVRFLLLEGSDAYAESYTSDDDERAALDFAARHSSGPIRTILDADGFMNLFRDAEMNAADLADLTAELEATFAPLSELQGLRFRSSSSVEDIEGFSGAGLYDSNTGFLDPVLQADEDDHKKTVERTIKKTWASYWSFEAFEERRIENVDHRSGGMGVLVHPRFDDALEQDNGVATLMLLPEGEAILTINVQAGDVSVTNPEAGSDVLPEQVVVRVGSAGDTTIERVAESTLVGGGTTVMTDESVLELLGRLEAVATLWRNRVNADLEPGQQVDVVTLDFEFKHMVAGWPAMADGEVRAARLVVKQARSLDPDLRSVPQAVLALPIPRDVLARAVLVEEVSCGATRDVVVTTVGEVWTEPIRFAAGGGIVESSDDETSCQRDVLFSSAEQYLVELLASGEGLQLG